MPQPTHFIFALTLAFFAGLGVATFAPVRAETPPAIDRSIIERLVRAEEQQVRALESLTRVTERCKRD